MLEYVGEHAINESKIHRIHVVSALALHHVVGILAAQGDEYRAKAARKQLEDLTQIVSRMGAIVCVIANTTAGAA